jgi:hypothetical protein
MTAWKRWSWRYRVVALFALALLLQGASCPVDIFQRPTFPVPGVGNVITERFIDDTGAGYFLVEQIDKNGARGFRRYYYPSREYVIIIGYITQRGDYLPGMWYPASSVPGAVGTLPSPPLQ